MHPIETGNVVMILVGIALVISGPWLFYSSVATMVRARRANPNADMQKFNNGLNLLIGVLFLLAGILFVVNNLRGNPLHFKTQTHSERIVSKIRSAV